MTIIINTIIVIIKGVALIIVRNLFISSSINAILNLIMIITAVAIIVTTNATTASSININITITCVPTWCVHRPEWTIHRLVKTNEKHQNLGKPMQFLKCSHVFSTS